MSDDEDEELAAAAASFSTRVRLDDSAEAAARYEASLARIGGAENSGAASSSSAEQSGGGNMQINADPQAEANARLAQQLQREEEQTVGGSSSAAAGPSSAGRGEASGDAGGGAELFGADLDAEGADLRAPYSGPTQKPTPFASGTLEKRVNSMQLVLQRAGEKLMLLEPLGRHGPGSPAMANGRLKSSPHAPDMVSCKIFTIRLTDSDEHLGGGVSAKGGARHLQAHDIESGFNRSPDGRSLGRWYLIPEAADVRIAIEITDGYMRITGAGASLRIGTGWQQLSDSPIPLIDGPVLLAASRAFDGEVPWCVWITPVEDASDAVSECASKFRVHAFEFASEEAAHTFGYDLCVFTAIGAGLSGLCQVLRSGKLWDNRLDGRQFARQYPVVDAFEQRSKRGDAATEQLALCKRG